VKGSMCRDGNGRNVVTVSGPVQESRVFPVRDEDRSTSRNGGGLSRSDSPSYCFVDGGDCKIRVGEGVTCPWLRIGIVSSTKEAVFLVEREVGSGMEGDIKWGGKPVSLGGEGVGKDLHHGFGKTPGGVDSSGWWW
jgi:hypothetical protein